MYIVKLYWLHIKYTIKAALQFKPEFISALFANFLGYFVTYVHIWVIATQFNVLDGWDYYDMIFLAAMQLFSYSIAVTTLYGVLNEMETYINTGKLDRVLLMPVNPIWSIIFTKFNWTGLSQIVLSAVFLGISITHLGVSWSLYKVVILMLCLMGGILIQSAAHIFFGALSFWMKKSTSLSRLLYYDLRYFTNYPLSIYGGFIRSLLTYVLPWAFINYYPALFILDKAENNSHYYLLTPVIGVCFFTCSLIIGDKAIQKYESVGN